MRRKLNSLTDLPTVPVVISQLLRALDNTDLPTKTIANLIERDQALTTRILRAANSPFYGFSRQISTVDLAVIIMGLNTIKEIVIGLVVQKFFSRISKSRFDVNTFWNYSLFSGSCCRLLARKLVYKLAGEAFVAGLMHDLGILIIVEKFSITYGRVIAIQEQENLSLVESEEMVMDCNHGVIGAWLAERWNLPAHLCESIRYHHVPFQKLLQNKESEEIQKTASFNSIDQPLTAIVSLSEWFAEDMGYKGWCSERRKSPLYLSSEIFEDLNENDYLNTNSAINVLKAEILEEYNRASEFTQIPARSVYK